MQRDANNETMVRHVLHWRLSGVNYPFEPKIYNLSYDFPLANSFYSLAKIGKNLKYFHVYVYITGAFGLRNKSDSHLLPRNSHATVPNVVVQIRQSDRCQLCNIN